MWPYHERRQIQPLCGWPEQSISFQKQYTVSYCIHSDLHTEDLPSSLLTALFCLSHPPRPVHRLLKIPACHSQTTNSDSRPRSLYFHNSSWKFWSLLLVFEKLYLRNKGEIECYRERGGERETGRTERNGNSTPPPPKSLRFWSEKNEVAEDITGGGEMIAKLKFRLLTADLILPCNLLPKIFHLLMLILLC